jgi:hypothetical protein
MKVLNLERMDILCAELFPGRPSPVMISQSSSFQAAAGVCTDKVFCAADISTCHQIKTSNGKPQIIVRFLSRSKVYEVFKHKRFMKKTVEFKNVFIYFRLLQTSPAFLQEKETFTAHMTIQSRM